MTELRRRSVRGFVIAAAYVLLACEDESPTRSADGGLAGTDASRMDARTDSSVPTETWIAEKTTLDVWWPGVPTRDPGRGSIDIYTLTHLTGGCGSNADVTTIKLCGITLPTHTSDLLCTASQLEIPQSAWDNPSMPTLSMSALDDVDAGGVAAKLATALIGIDLDADGAWPGPTVTTTLTCVSGSGTACFPDHDGDTFPGVTAFFRIDGATYVGPYDTGLCASQNRAFEYHGDAVQLDIYAGAGGQGLGLRSDRLHLGMRARVGGPVPSGTECGGIRGDHASEEIRLRAIDCAVDPTTLDRHGFPQADPRVASMDYACTPAEAQFADEALPEYRVLQPDELPGNTMLPISWLLAQRDIDRTPSEGTRTESITLNVEDIDAGSDGEPSCAQVRAVFGNE